MAKVEWTKSSLSDLERIDHLVAVRIVKKVTWLAANFDDVIHEPLGGQFKGTYKQRVGDYRVVYTIEKNAIVVRFVGHHREVYR